MASRIITLSGWGQPFDALAVIVPQATHINYAYHADIEEALNAIAAEAQDHDTVIGWSLGGQLLARAMAAGMLRPQKLVLIATPYQFVATEENPLGMKRELYDKFRDNVARQPGRALHKAWELVLKGDSRAAEVRTYLDKQDKKKTLEIDWLYWLDRLDGFSFDGTDFAASFAQFPPTLLIHGRRDAVVGYEHSQHFFDAIPDAKLMMLPEAGHAPHWHDAGAVREAIEEFVKIR